jgi:hypothetical protein
MKAIGGDCPSGEVTKEKCRTYKEGMTAQKLSASSVRVAYPSLDARVH